MRMKYFDEKRFIFGEEIGRGGDGIVISAQRVDDRKECAIKFLSLNSSSDVYFFNSEREVMHKLNKRKHKNIIFPDFFVNEDHNQALIVMDKLDCDLWSYIYNRVRLHEREAKSIAKQLCKALAFMQSKKISHLDIKPENILVNLKDNSIQLCDFVRAFDYKKLRNKLVDESVGHRISREYRAPEVANMEEYRVDKLDQWSVGVVLYNMLLADYPHDKIYDEYEDYNEEVFIDIHSKRDYLLKQIGISENCFDVLRLLLNRDPELRPSFRKLLKHPFFK